jgi:phosphatidylinositol alpha-1,6-mannosyltransferase
MLDRLWLKMRRSRFSLPELIAFQTRRKLVYLGRRTNADFLFADQLCSASSVRVSAQLLGIPWGLAVHGKELLVENLETRSLLADADLIIANSDFSKELAKSRGANEERIKVLHPAVDTNFFIPPSDKDATRRQLGVDGRETLVTVAHLVKRKGHEQVIQALPTIKSVYPEVIYLAVGSGPYENSLRRLVKDLGVSEAVRFCGFVPAQELPLYYGAADIHVMASTFNGDVEGFGISFIEAAACGTTSIGSRTGGIPDAVADGETGFLVEPGDVQGLSKTIVKLLDNKKIRDQMGFSARKMVEIRFSENVFSRNLMNFLNQTVLSKQQ